MLELPISWQRSASKLTFINKSASNGAPCLERHAARHSEKERGLIVNPSAFIACPAKRSILPLSLWSTLVFFHFQWPLMLMLINAHFCEASPLQKNPFSQMSWNNSLEPKFRHFLKHRACVSHVWTLVTIFTGHAACPPRNSGQCPRSPPCVYPHNKALR